MLFNSFSFLLFFPVVCIIYFLIPHKYRWLLLLIASYYFYMNWIPVYGLLLLGSTIVTYVCAILLERESKRRNKHIILTISLILNFGTLFFYKYFNFVNNSVYKLLGHYGITWGVPDFDVLLPVGISFYIFQTVGYTIDVYRGDLKAERHFGIYALFISFFPQLVAGPIERATNLLPQFYSKHIFSYERVVNGLKLMLWGFFMKVVVADRLSLYVDAVYNNAEHHNGTTLLTATLFFTFQIYCDFAGYSNIAIGTARVLGFDLMANFRQPYFAKSIPEFWRRWHISLSTWFRDYLYFPLGGNRVPYLRWQFNLVVTFIISGIWHGANWTFVVWGLLHGLFQIISNLFKRTNLVNDEKSLVSKLVPGFILSSFNTLTTFLLVSFAWIFFRARDLETAMFIIKKIVLTNGSLYKGHQTMLIPYCVLGVFMLLLVEYFNENKIKFSLFENNRVFVRHLSYTALILLILLFGVFDGGQFIYFQF
jgi:alginate O-acetyltransferase complex protein AlgI